MGMLPLLSMEAGANKVYICEPHGFLAKLAYAGVQRHTMLTFERENWARLPMNVALAERVKQAGSIAYRAGQYERAISLYTEALPPTEHVRPPPRPNPRRATHLAKAGANAALASLCALASLRPRRNSRADPPPPRSRHRLPSSR